MLAPPYAPPWWLRSGLAMTIYASRWGSRHWQQVSSDPEPDYREQVFTGADQVPIYGWVAVPAHCRGTIIATYGITGTLQDQWIVRVLGRKAIAQGYAVVLFDWRAHGQTATLSPTLTSDGLLEGEDFRQIALHSQSLGCAGPFWFVGYSLGGQLALWGGKAIQERGGDLQFGGTAVICPSLESNRSLRYLMADPLGRYLEKRLAMMLKQLAWEIHHHHPESVDPKAIEAANSIWAFDEQLVIPRLGFSSVEEYYAASSPLPWLSDLNLPTLILYAADDPMFDPSLVPELEQIAAANSALDLILTPRGGHVGYLSSSSAQARLGDPDPWWALNRLFDWIRYRSALEQEDSIVELTHE